MWFKNLKRYILLDFFMMKKKKIAFCIYFILYFHFTIYYLLIMIYCIFIFIYFSLCFNCKEDRDMDLCFGEKYTYKNILLHCVFIHILLYIIPNYKIYFVTLQKTSNLKHNFK